MKPFPLILAAAPMLLAGSPPACPSPDGTARYCVTIIIRNGLTARASESVLNPGTSRVPPQFKATLDAYLDNALPQLGRPYRLILSADDQIKDDQGDLDSNPDRKLLHDANLTLAEYAEPLQAWCDRYDDCQASAAVVLSPAGLYRDFVKYHDAPLLFDPGLDPFDAETGVVVFRVPAPFDSATVAIRIPTLSAARELSRIRALRKWTRGLDGQTFLRDPVVARLTRFYDAMGLDPEISISFDGPQPSITILEGSRIRSLAFPYGLPVTGREADWRKTEIALYSVLPDAVFRQGYLKNRSAIQARMENFSTPVLDLQQDLDVAPQSLPYASRLRIPIQQLLLQQDGFSLTVTGASRRLLPVPGEDGTPSQQEFSLLDLRLEDISQTPQTNIAPAAATAPADSLGMVDPHSAETRPQPSFVKSTPAGKGLVTPSYCDDDPTLSKPKTAYAGVGGQYLPGQGIRAFALAQKSELPLPYMDAALSVRAGSGGGPTALATASFSADYIAFEQIHHRLSFALEGGQDSVADRFLLGSKLDEHRRGGMVRTEFEWFRDRDGHLLKLFAEGHHDTVTLSKSGTGTLKQNVTTIDFGAVHLYQSAESPLPWLLRLEPDFLVAPSAANQQGFHRIRLAARFEHALPARYALHLAGRFEQSSRNTPEFDLPSLGGADSVRGFRQDDALGQRLWSLQNELWTPVPALTSVDFVRDNLRLATFFDLGNAYRTGEQHPGLRKGTGLGVRMTYGPVVLKADVAYGIGHADTHSRKLQFYFGATINLPI